MGDAREWSRETTGSDNRGNNMQDTSRPIDIECINTIRTLSIDAVQKANSGHPGAPMGMAPVMYCLWDRFLRHDPSDPEFANRDRFVLSMGHASMLLYSTLHLTGYDVSLDDLKSFRCLHSKCAGHPENTLIAGVETTTGPLGQGVATSVGMAIAERFLAATFNREGHEIVDYNVYALCSDGDLMEGVSSEAASIAGHLGLGNLVWIYDSNGITIDGGTGLAFTENVAARFQAYGWRVLHVRDANNLDEVHVAIEAGRDERDRPTLIVVNSVIGYGSPNRGGTSKAHGEPLGADEVRLTKESYGFDPDATFVVSDAVRKSMTEGACRRGEAMHSAWDERFDAYASAYPELAERWRALQSGELPADWDAGTKSFEADAKGMATRASSGKVLEQVAGRVPWMMGGAADLLASTKTKVSDSGVFQKGEYGGRNLAFGIREHGMAAIMNGLALSKIRPFGSSFLTFTDYCRPAIRLAALSKLPCVFVFTHDSIGLGEDGPTHQPVEHVASLRAMPNLDVIRPCDANEVVEAWKYIMPISDRPVLLALTRQNVPTFDRKRFASADGLMRGGYVLADCDGTPDVILMASGSEVQHCVFAWEKLTGQGVKARVVSMPCWEAFERQDSAYRESVLPSAVRARISVEAGVTFGWSKWVGADGVSMGVDRYGESAPLDDVMGEFGLTGENVYAEAKTLLKSAVGNGRAGASAVKSDEKSLQGSAQ
jgi:transketolase